MGAGRHEAAGGPGGAHQGGPREAAGPGGWVGRVGFYMYLSIFIYMGRVGFIYIMCEWGCACVSVWVWVCKGLVSLDRLLGRWICRVLSQVLKK